MPNLREWLVLLLAVGATGCRPQVQPQTPFPEIDASRLKITLSRSGCLGPCPVYDLTIDGTGRAVFETPALPDGFPDTPRSAMLSWSAVLVPGRHVEHVAPAVVTDLVDQFRRAQFFALREEYSRDVTDLPTLVVGIDTGHAARQVVDYDGREAGMPAAVTALQDAVDRAAGSRRWIDGADGLIAWLEKSGFDFHSTEATDMLLAGVHKASDATLTELVRRGAPLEVDVPSQVSGPRPAPHRPAGVMLIEAAIRAGRAPLFEELARRGWLARLGGERAGQAFADLGAGCNLAMVQAYARAGLSLDATSKVEEMGFNSGHTALAALNSNDYCDYDSGRQRLVVKALLQHGANPNHEDASGDTPLFGADVEMAALLLAHGADPNHRNHEGETPIFGVDKPVLELLLAHGADPRAKDSNGRSALLRTFDDEAAIRLLHLGADPTGRREDGRSLRVMATQNHMARTLTWLDSFKMP